MTPEPLVLFEAPPAYVGRFRRTDPETSRGAAAQLTGRVDRSVYMHLKISGQTLTADQLAEELHVYQPTCVSALSRLLRDGYVEVAGFGESTRRRKARKYRAVSE